MTDHEFNSLGKTPLQQFYSRQILHVGSINSWAVLKLSVGSLCYFLIIGVLEDRCRLVS